ncbi:MAG TPA: GNAT family N-acetyltransferase, partial [Myxococcaceae bacterium]|nr:GNAT family N-acetyltransferase [Myxococcaceae bacterium]
MLTTGLPERRVVEVTDERSRLARRSLELIQEAIWDVHPIGYLLAELEETRRGLAHGGEYHLLAMVEPGEEEPLAAAAGCYLQAVNSGFVAYLAVREEQRGRGLGRELREHL